ncbi:ecto-NOX disulfide-thiol exchanger 2 isoform X1 [Bombyx mori]|uniref:RRM domain-containing protein n=1 Tax=Bombyx mori TaxID=7091 RepID=A0A8R2R0M8_BOMMO|nr:ecto-NOX disulfide-thiol exchanger 2 isoform X1 [Bombyx mori]
MQGHRRHRSRSPLKESNGGRRRDGNSHESKRASDLPNANVMNAMMLQNMYQQSGMMMAGGMYPNMIMPSSVMGGGIMPSTGMEIMSTTGIEIMPQPSMDVSAIGTPTISTPGSSTIDMNMMGGMVVDPAMMGIYGMTGDLSNLQEKKEIVFKNCKLIPPDSGTPQPPRRAKPPGCRTIFIGGLPDKIRESSVREIFENYGRIISLRLSRKNFCHIRYDRESCVDAAMTISGYRVKLINKDGDNNGEEQDTHGTVGWLHVDYAMSRDDQNEFERRQRQALRVQQAQMQQLNAQQEILNSTNEYRQSPSPVRIQPYSNPAMVQLSEKIKSEEHFSSALPTLLAWLERGECSKKNSNQFYSMIQATNSHIRRLFNEKMQAEEELQECKDRIRKTMENVIDQLEQVAKVFTASTHQRVWDHFTKPQRKNIETWQKMAQEFSTLKEELFEKFYNDDDYNGCKASDGYTEDIQVLKRENESLRFQLEAYKNEVDLIKADSQKEMEKFKAQFIARQALQGIFENRNVSEPPLPSPVTKPPPPPPLPDDMNSKVHLNETVEVGCGEAKLIGVMSAFLQVHPQGASLDYVLSYVRAVFPAVSQAAVHRVLQRHADVFSRTTSGVGANIEHRWNFVAFQNADSGS